jgi:transcriptional regulator with XRE-family HTH domain
MADLKAINDRKKRAAILRTIVGDDIDNKTRTALETAEGAEEAARFIREMREAANLTQSALGKKLGITQARVSEMERGGTPEGVSYAAVRRVAQACGFPDWPAAPAATLAAQHEAGRSHLKDQMRVHVYALDAIEFGKLGWDAGRKRKHAGEDTAIVHGKKRRIAALGKKAGAAGHGKKRNEHVLVVETGLGRKKRQRNFSELQRKREQWRLIHDVFSSNPNFKVIEEG